MSKIEIRRWDNNEIIVCGEYESIATCIEKNKDKSFFRANLRSADLSSANLSSANLSSADLRYADLSYADLSSANLSSADLSYADLSKRYIQVSCIGSRKGMTTYCFDDDFIWCGCWKGTLEEFEKQVKATHKNNKQYLKEYLGFIKYVRGLR
jgi:hypothetical protein